MRHDLRFALVRNGLQVGTSPPLLPPAMPAPAAAAVRCLGWRPCLLCWPSLTNPTCSYPPTLARYSPLFPCAVPHGGGLERGDSCGAAQRADAGPPVADRPARVSRLHAWLAAASCVSSAPALACKCTAPCPCPAGIVPSHTCLLRCTAPTACREVRVQWVTLDRGHPSVRWGTASGSLEHIAAGDSLTYSRADMCGPPANTSGWMQPGWLHGAVMSGLQPATRYFYQYGDEVRGRSGRYGRWEGSRDAAGWESELRGAAGRWQWHAGMMCSLLVASNASTCAAQGTPLPNPPPFSQELGWSAEESFVSPPAVGPESTVHLLAVADLGQAEADGCAQGCWSVGLSDFFCCGCACGGSVCGAIRVEQQLPRMRPSWN